MTEADYDALAEDYAAYRADRNGTDWRLGYPAVVEALGPVAGKRVLDFGCGAGHFGRLLADGGATVVNVDKSPEMVRLAGENNPASAAFVRHAPLSELVEGEVDAVTANFVFCAIFRNKEVSEALAEILAVLRPGGMLVMLEPNHERSNGVEFRTHVFLRREGLRCGDNVQVRLKAGRQVVLTDVYRSQQEYRRLLESAGFRLRSITEPTAPLGWGPAWEAEKRHPPYVVYSAAKPGDG
jgi:SAM-dependent methyltransferase